MWPFLRGCFTSIEVVVVSIRTRVLGRFITCGCSLEVVVNGGSTACILFSHYNVSSCKAGTYNAIIVIGLSLHASAIFTMQCLI